MTTVLAVLGSVTPSGRLHTAVMMAVETARTRPGVSASLPNLGDHRISFADGRPLEAFTDDAGTVVARVGEADAVLLASPVYRGSFTGALKNFLDLTPVEALRNKPVGIVAMGATLHHYLGVD
jgi:NAD(P)H-dependent FMN reductase